VSDDARQYPLRRGHPAAGLPRLLRARFRRYVKLSERVIQVRAQRLGLGHNVVLAGRALYSLSREAWDRARAYIELRRSEFADSTEE